MNIKVAAFTVSKKSINSFVIFKGDSDHFFQEILYFCDFSGGGGGSGSPAPL